MTALNAGVALPDAMGRLMLSAAASSGDTGALRLAAQLAGVPPCEGCGYRKEFCRCAAGVMVDRYQVIGDQTPMPSDKDQPR